MRIYRYDLVRIKANGVEKAEKWSGNFYSMQDAKDWYEHWGKYWESQGKDLKLITIKKKKGEKKMKKEEKKNEKRREKK